MGSKHMASEEVRHHKFTEKMLPVQMTKHEDT